MNNNICIYFESYLTGGLDTFAIELINNWPKGDNITLFCNKSHGGASLFKSKIKNENCNIIIHNMPMLNDVYKKFFGWNKLKLLRKLFKLGIYYFLIPYYIIFSFNTLNLRKYNKLISINGGYPACLSSRCVNISWFLHTGKKAIHNFHNFAIKSSFPLFLADYFVDILLKKSVSYFISVSNICSESLRNRKIFKNLKNIKHVYNGIDDKIVVPSFDIYKKLNISKNNKLFIMLATYEKRKGHSFIMDVINRVKQTYPNIHLIFLGYGNSEDISELKMEAVKKNLGNNISFLAYQENAMEFLAQADYVLIGSQDFESFGLTAIEAMKYKKIVFSTNQGGLKEVIENGHGGFVFEKNDVEAMSTKILYIINEATTKEIEEIKENGIRRISDKFNVKQMVSKYQSFLNA